MGDHLITIDVPTYEPERVPDWVRNVDVPAYEPRYISIGPIHRGKYDNPLRRQDLKMDCVWSLIKEPNQFDIPGLQPKSIEDCRRALRPEGDKARRFYAEKFDDIDEYEWVEMLLQDGCFIILHLLQFTRGIKSRHTISVLNVLKTDLILLENQLPFFILEGIMHFVFSGLVEDDEDISCMLKQFVVHYWAFRARGAADVEKLDKLVGGTKFKYIYHLVHLIHLSHCEVIYKEDITRDNILLSCIWKTKRAIRYTPILVMWLLSWPHEFCKQLLEKLENNEKRDDGEDDEENIPTATIVHSLGIHFKKKKSSLGLQSKYAVCINARDDSTMDIPQMEVSSSKAPLLYNLIAWEQSFKDSDGNHNADNDNDYRNKGHFTKYAFLMYNLINSSDDISLLQKEGILLNQFGTDEQVVTYFKNLVVYNARRPTKTTKEDNQRDKEVKSKSRGEIEIDEIMDLLKHRVQKPEYRYWAEVKKYFSSPLQVLLVITSFVLFVSTLVPAILSFHQTK